MSCYTSVDLAPDAGEELVPVAVLFHVDIVVVKMVAEHKRAIEVGFGRCKQ